MKSGFPSVFMTHAKDDKSGSDFFDHPFASSNVQANWYPYTGGRTYPHIFGIRSAIEASSSLFVVLSKEMETKAHTRSWVSYEAGIAVGMNRPVWVFEPVGQRIDIPVPGAWGYLQRPPETATAMTFPFERIVKSAGTEYPMADSEVWFQGVCGRVDCRERFVAHVLDPSSARCPTCRRASTIRRQTEGERTQPGFGAPFLKPERFRPLEVADTTPITVHKVS
jgi:hypothetical protein